MPTLHPSVQRLVGCFKRPSPIEPANSLQHGKLPPSSPTLAFPPRAAVLRKLPKSPKSPRSPRSPFVERMNFGRQFLSDESHDSIIRSVWSRRFRDSEIRSLRSSGEESMVCQDASHFEEMGRQGRNFDGTLSVWSLKVPSAGSPLRTSFLFSEKWHS